MTRAVLVVLCLLLIGLTLLGMRRGWRNRIRRQAYLPPLPTAPERLGAETLRSSGVYVGTTFASSWQDRVVHDGLGVRSEADAVLHPEGVLIERTGTEPVYLPAGSWRAARLAPGLAGKVMGEGGLLVIRWELGEALLDTAFRADDKTSYPAWVAAINERVSA
jgi:hypothetical protein